MKLNLSSSPVWLGLLIAVLPARAVVPELVIREDALPAIDTVELLRNGLYWWTGSFCTETANRGGASYQTYSDQRFNSTTATLYNAPPGSSGGFKAGDTLDTGMVLAEKPSGQRGALLPDCGYGGHFVRDDEAFYYTQDRQLFRKPLTSAASAPGESINQLSFDNPRLPVVADGVLFVTDTELWSYVQDVPNYRTAVIRTTKRGTTVPQTVMTLTGVGVRKFTIVDIRGTDGRYLRSEILLLQPGGQLYRAVPFSSLQLIRTGVSDFAVRDESYLPPSGDFGVSLRRYGTTLYMALGNLNTPQGDGRLLGLDLNPGGRAEFVEFNPGPAFRVTSVAVDKARVFLTRTPFQISGQPNSDLLRRGAPADTTTFNVGDLDYATIAVSREFRSLRSTGRLLYFAHINTVQRLSANAPAINLDFEAFGIEVTQGIQNLNNTVDLVAGKRVIVRGYARVALNSTRLSVFDVPGHLRVRHSKTVLGQTFVTELADSPYLPVQAPGVTAVGTLDTVRTNLGTTFQFDIPAELVAEGKMIFDFVLNTGRSVPETGNSPLMNNTASATLPVRIARPPVLVFTPMLFGGGIYDYNAPNSGFWNIIARAQSLLPVAGLRVFIRNAPVTKPVVTLTGIKARSFDIPDNEEAALNWLSITRLFDDPLNLVGPLNSHYVGMFPPGASPWNGLGFTPGFSSIVRMASTGYSTQPWNSLHGGFNVAHEFAHNLGFKHIMNSATCGSVPGSSDGTYDSIPNGASQCTMGATDLNDPATAIGFDPLSWSAVLPAANGDLMSYASQVWTSEYNWKRLLESFAVNLSAASLSARAPRRAIGLQGIAAAPLLIVHGVFHATANTGELFPAYALPPALFNPDTLAELTELPAELPPDFPLRLQLVNTAGVVLVDQPAPSQPLSDGKAGTGIIRRALPMHADARTLQLVHAGNVLAEVIISASAPELELAEPVPDGNNVNLSWTASDADGDALYFNIQFSPDDGQSWQTLNVNCPETNYSFRTDLLAGSATARVRVIATDGIHTALATSEPFVLPKHAPAVQITGVTDGQQFDLGTVIGAEGFGYDAEDGSLGGAALQWALTGPEVRNRAGSSFSLSTLSPGLYTLALTGTDADGQAATQTIQFIIRALSVADGAEPVLDGLCADPGYGNTPPVRFAVAGSGYSTAHFTHANGALFVCFTGLRYGTTFSAGASVGLRVDTAGSGQLGANAAGFAVDENGGVYRIGGDGTKFVSLTSPPSGFIVVILRDENTWSAEMRIADTLLGGWNHQLGLVVLADDGSLATPPETWPPNTDVVTPSTWPKSQAGPLSPLASDGNLLPYGYAEGLSGGNGTTLVPIPGWTVTGTVTVTKWNTPDGFPVATDPGPDNRGLNFFSGGPDGALNTATTVVNLNVSPSRIDAGLVAAELSGWLGGFATQEDSATLTATFLDAAGVRLDSLSIGPVTAQDRGNVTAFLSRNAIKVVPVNARQVEAVLEMRRPLGGFNDGYADNLSLILRDSGVTAPLNSPPLADAGAPQTQSVTGGESVVLDGSASSDPEGAPLAYTWSQVTGMPLAFTGGATAKPSFTAPALTAPASWTFELVVNDGVQDSAPALTQVTLQPPEVVVVTIFDNLNGVFNGNFGATPTTWQAGKFCLGSQPYQLDSVAMPLGVSGFDVRTNTVRLQIFSNDAASGKPSASTGVIMDLSGMTNPIPLRPDATLVTWTPATSFILAADTCYWAVLSVESGAGVWQTATETMAIGEARALGRASSENAGATWEMLDNAYNHKMLIRGTASTAPQELSVTAISLLGNELRISFPTHSGRSYVIESRAVLDAGEWAEIAGTTTTANGTPLQVSIPNAFTEPQQFYRVKQLP